MTKIKRVLPKGHKSILDPSFTYVPASNTDLERTFARIRKELGLAGKLEVVWNLNHAERK